MKHFTKLLTLLLALVTGQAAYAQLGVRISTNDVKYEYYLRVTAGSDLIHYACLPAENEDILTLQNSSGTKAKFIFKESSTSGYYDIYVTNASKKGDAAVYWGTTMEDSAYPLTVGVGGTPTPFSLIPKTASNGPLEGYYALWITPSENGSTYNTWAKNSSAHLLNRSDSQRQWAVWLLESAAPAPITFSSYTEGALATYSTAIAATIPGGVKAYIAGNLTGNDNVSTLALTEITGTIPAGVGVLLENTGLSGVAYPTEPENSASEMTSNFTPTTLAAANAPTYSTTDITESATGPITVAADGDDATTYVLGNPTGGSGLGFYPLSSEDRTIAAYKAYYSGPKQGTAGSSIKLQFPDGTTGILNIDGTGVKDAPVYDLTGRRVAKQTRGCLYISNGKKFIAQ